MPTKIIISKRESSTLVSTWNEYLTIRKICPGRAVLEVCQYECLAEWNGYEDEDGDEKPIPESYNGKSVIGVEDGYLVGGDLSVAEYDGYEFSIVTLNDAKNWIVAEGFSVGIDIDLVLRRHL